MPDAAVDFIAVKTATDNPFFLLTGMTRPQFPNLPSEEFDGKSRIGYGDCVMSWITTSVGSSESSTTRTVPLR